MIHLFHNWKTIHGIEDLAAYQVCGCGKRRYVQYSDNCLPVDDNWLKTGQTTASKSAPPEPRHDPFLHAPR
mgnify:CR=1 FL=1